MSLPETVRVARKATVKQAKRAFEAGREVLVTERPEGAQRGVYKDTTVHHKSQRSFAELLALVDEFSRRYPRQTFYIVEE